MAELFGFKFERIKDSGSQEKFTEPSSEDGTLEVAGGGFYGQLLDTDGRERTEQDLIRRYRDIAQQPECDSAIELSSAQADAIETFDVTWKYTHLEASAVNF